MTPTEHNTPAIGDQPARIRPLWWRELLLIAIVYTLTRNTLPEHVCKPGSTPSTSTTSGQHLHLNIERSLNRILFTARTQSTAAWASRASRAPCGDVTSEAAVAAGLRS